MDSEPPITLFHIDMPSALTSLFIRIHICFPDHTKISLYALVDTGCPVSIINSKVVPTHVLVTPHKKKHFVGVNGSTLSGGSQGCVCKLKFATNWNRTGKEGIETFQNFLYTADLRCPMLQIGRASCRERVYVLV